MCGGVFLFGWFLGFFPVLIFITPLTRFLWRRLLGWEMGSTGYTELAELSERPHVELSVCEVLREGKPWHGPDEPHLCLLL